MVCRVVVPPNTIKVAQVKLVDSVDEDRMFCIEPHMKNKGLLISATVTLGKSKVPVQIVNDLDRFVVLKALHSVGIATEIHEIIGTESEREDLKVLSQLIVANQRKILYPHPPKIVLLLIAVNQRKILHLLLYFKRLIVANQPRIHCLLYFRSLIVTNQLTSYQLPVLTNLIVVNQILVH